MFNLEELKSMWVQYSELANQIRGSEWKKMESEYNKSIVLAPATTNSKRFLYYSGGLMRFSLDIINNYKNFFKDIFSGSAYDFKESEFVFVSLFHLIGLTSVDSLPVLIPESSSWHIDNLGRVYNFNENIPYMQTSMRSIYILQKYFNISHNEFVAIKLSDGLFNEDNFSYFKTDPGNFNSLSFVFNTVKTYTIKKYYDLRSSGHVNHDTSFNLPPSNQQQ